MKRISLKLTALFLVLACLLPAAVSCGNPADDELTVLDHVFKPNFIEIEKGMNYVQNMTVIGEDTICLRGGYEKDGEYRDSALYLCNFDGSNGRYVFLDINEETDSDGDVVLDGSASVMPMPIPRNEAAVTIAAAEELLSPESEETADEAEESEETAAETAAAAPAVKSIVTKRAIAETAVAVTTSGPAPVVKPTPDGKGEDKIHISKYIGDIIPCEDGTVWVTENWYIYNEETYVSENKIYLVKRELEGDVEELARLDIMSFFEPEEDEYFYINKVYYSDGTIYAFSENCMAAISAEGEKLFEIEFDEYTYIQNIIKTDDGILLFHYDNEGDGGYVFRKLDPVSKSLGEKVPLEGIAKNYAYSIFTGEGYDFYFNDQNSVYGYDIATGKSTEVLNWINSDIDSSSISGILAVNSEKFICTTYDYNVSKMELVILDYVAPEDVLPKKIITLGTAYLSYELRPAVVRFNRNNDTYRIAVREYQGAALENEISSAEALNNDIIAGNVPDILCINTEMPYHNYVAKGLFADLNEFFENDETIKKSDYFENILKAFETDGKLYSIAPVVYLRTVVAKTAFAGDVKGWTLDEMSAALAKNPGMAPFYDITRSQMMQYALTFGINQFIDQATGKCSFDSKGFIDLLEFAKSLSTKSVYEDFDYDEVGEDYWIDIQNQYRDNKILASMEYIDSYDGYWRILKGKFGDDISFVGFPAENRQGSGFETSFELAVSSQSKNAEGAWQFVKYFLSDDYQDTINYGFPIKLSKLNELAEEAKEPYYYTDYEGNKVMVETTYWIGNEEIVIGEIDDEHIKKLNEVLGSVTTVIRYDNSMMEIINSEAEMFFNGQKSAEEVSKLVQNRVQTYISEGR